MSALHTSVCSARVCAHSTVELLGTLDGERRTDLREGAQEASELVRHGLCLPQPRPRSPTVP